MEVNMDNKKFALLIDAENISAEYVEGILSEIAEYGVASYKRMYGDFTNPMLAKWNEKAIEHSIVQVQQPRYSKAKNSSDIMLVIDAMDILHTDKVEGFCIVSSDSDFTRLVNRLSEGGMEVIGMGKRDASRSLKAACTEYKGLEILVENDTSENEPIVEPIEIDHVVLDDVQNDSGMELDTIKEAIKDIIIRKDANGKTTGLGEVGSQLVKTYSDFDIRNYGYKSLTTFVEDMAEFELIKDGTTTSVMIADNKTSKSEIEDYITSLLRNTAMDIGTIGRKVHEKYSGFRVQDYGYSKFERFLSSICALELKENDDKTKQKLASLRE